MTLLLLVAVCAPGGAVPGQITSNPNIEAEIVRLTNEQRHQHGLGELQPQIPKLVDAARAHSEEMILMDYFEHESPTPGLVHPWDRVFKTGIKSNRVAENIFSADGYSLAEVAEECVSDWMNSPPHRANILEPANTCVGVGIAMHPSSSGKGVEVLVTQEFTGPIEGN